MKKIPLPFILIVWALRGAVFLGVGLTLVPARADASGVFENTGSLGTARDRQSATLLPNGLVLVAGGLDNTGAPLASAELYDPASGTWAPTGSLGTARYRQAAILLRNGLVLVAGGQDNSGNPIASAELYDPASGTWTPTGSLVGGLDSRATLLSNGQVLAAGGLDNTGTPIASAELYDPASGTWTPTGSLGTARDRETVTLLPGGLVLAAGGLDNTGTPIASAELYNPVSGTWTPTGNLATARDRFGAILLPNGKVVAAGGVDSTGATLASAELYDPASGTWTPTGSLGTPLTNATVTLLPDGQVLVAGGVDNTGATLASAELYDPASGTWTLTGNLNTARAHHTATLLPDGKTLVAGGLDSSGFPLASAELYDLGPPIITSPLAATGTIDLPFVYQFEASGATSLSVTEIDLPGGLLFDPTLSAITGQPGQSGTFQVGISASNSSGTTNATLVITIQPTPTSGPVIMSSTSAKGRTGSSFTFQVLTSGASSLARLTATGLPPGLSSDPVTGLISGIVLIDGSSAVTLSVTDGNQTTTSSLQLSFSSDLALPVIISPSTAALLIGQPFGYTIVAPSSDSSDPVTYVLLGQLPAGLGFDPVDGIISGTFPGRFERVPSPNLSGGIVTNVQLFATNSHGTGTIPLLFLQTPTGAINISTRLAVGTNTDVLIGGFIVTGNAPKRVLIRAIGPSLSVGGTLADPTLELHDSSGTLGANDNWRDSQEQEIMNTTIPPTNDLESAILATLAPLDPTVPGSGAYTVIVGGKNNSTGIGLVEVYDLGTASLDGSSESHLANISTRGKVQTADNVMIGGFIVAGSNAANILVRAIGPELTALGVAGAIQDTTLELHDGSGNLLTSNDDWQSTQEQEIIATGVPPTDPRESAIVAALPPGNYTAIVRGKNNTTGVALVEAYVLP